MKKKFDVLTAGVTFGVSFLFCVLSIVVLREVKPAGVAAALAVGISFFVTALASFAAMRIVSAARKSLTVNLPSLKFGFAALLLLLCFIVGFAGQFLYSFRIVRSEQPEPEPPRGSNIALLLDASGSMEDYVDTVTAASVLFTESLSENCSLYAGIFDFYVKDSEPLTVMDPAGKAKMTAFLENRYVLGGMTNIDHPLQTAKDVLNAQNDGKEKAVVMLTDGFVKFLTQTKNDYLADQIKLYTIRIAGSENKDADELVDFVNATGGFDTVISDATMQSDMEALKKVFQAITQEVDQPGVTTEFSDGYVLYDETVSASRVAIRFAVFVLLVVLVQLLLIGRMDLPGILVSAAAAILTTAGVTLAGYAEMVPVCALLPAICVYTALIRLNVVAGNGSDFGMGV